MNCPLISVIVPAYDESYHLAKLLRTLSTEKEIEVVVSIPAGDRVSAETAKGFDVRVVEGETGRGAQLVKGVETAKGKIFLFCHADTILPPGWKRLVTNALAGNNITGGAFRLKVASPRLSYRLIIWSANLRGSLLGLVYGDQAIFTTRGCYGITGGFKTWPIMEDVDFVRRLRRMGKFVVLDEHVITSTRRLEKEGAFYYFVRNAVLIFLFLLGVSPARLADWYRP